MLIEIPGVWKDEAGSKLSDKVDEGSWPMAQGQEGDCGRTPSLNNQQRHSDQWAGQPCPEEMSLGRPRPCRLSLDLSCLHPMPLARSLSTREPSQPQPLIADKMDEGSPCTPSFLAQFTLPPPSVCVLLLRVPLFLSLYFQPRFRKLSFRGALAQYPLDRSRL